MPGYRLFERLDLAVSGVKDALRTPPVCADLRPAWQRLADRWRLPGDCPDRPQSTLPLLRALAPQMCEPCWRRWRCHRRLRHRACACALSTAIDVYYERTR